MKKDTIVLAGGSGLLGQLLVKQLSEWYDFVVLSRSKQTHFARQVYWDGISEGLWEQELEGAKVVINLSGRSVDCRYHEQNKKEILLSRTQSTEAIGRAIQKCKQPPALWINASSATIYRHAEDRPMDEYTGELGEGFSVDVCRAWEQTFNKANTPQTRKIALRIAMVLSKEGGVLPVLNRLVKTGLGGKQGPGSQYMSWLHEKDYVSLIKWLIENSHISGTLNATAPYPVKNHRFMKVLRQVNHVPIGLPATNWMLEVGAWVLQTETELILKSRRVVPKKLQEQGFHFSFPEIEEALKELVN